VVGFPLPTRSSQSELVALPRYFSPGRTVAIVAVNKRTAITICLGINIEARNNRILKKIAGPRRKTALREIAFGQNRQGCLLRMTEKAASSASSSQN
jgi:hypothetical protein